MTVLEAWHPWKDCPSDRIPGKAFAGTDYRKAKWANIKKWKIRTRDVSGLRDLMALRAEVADRGGRIIVRGTPLVAEGTVGQRLADKGRAGDTLADDARHWAMLDLDGILNAARIDPAREPGRALGFLTGLLPLSIATRTLGYDWSSSSGLPGRATLDCHLWAWFDQARTGAVLKPLFQRVDRYVKHQLALHCEEHGRGRVDPSKRYVDPKVLEAQQPHYVARPKFSNGAVDPHPGDSRWGILQGDGDVVSLAELEAELAAFEAEHAAEWKLTPEQKRKAAKKQAKVRKPRVAAVQGPVLAPAPRPRPLTQPQPVNVVSLQAARRQLEARRQQVGTRTAMGRQNSDLADFVRGALDEIVQGILWRVQSGAWDERWAEWHDQGGIPEGSRSNLFTIISSLVVESLPDGLADDQVQAQIFEVGQLVVGRDWLRDEWTALGYDRAIIDRYQGRSAGEKVLFNGREKDPTYGYGKETIIEAFAWDWETADLLGWKHLATKAQRQHRARAEDGAVSRQDYLQEMADKSQEHDVRIQALMDQGMSVRKIVAELAADGIVVGKTKVSQAIARLRQAPVQPAAAPAPAPAPAPVAEAPKPTKQAARPSRAEKAVLKFGGAKMVLRTREYLAEFEEDPADYKLTPAMFAAAERMVREEQAQLRAA